MKIWDFSCEFCAKGAMFLSGEEYVCDLLLCPSCVDWLSRHDFSPDTSSSHDEMLEILEDQYE